MLRERMLLNQFQLDQGFDKGMPSMRKFTHKMGSKFGEMDEEIIRLSKDIDKLPLTDRERNRLTKRCQVIYDLIWEIHGAFCDVSMDYDLEPKRTRPLRRPDSYEMLSEE